MSLCRNKEPRPQDTLHALHAVHVDMMQSTRREEKKGVTKYLRVLFCLITNLEVSIYLTAVFLIRSIHTVLLQVTSAVQVNALPTGT